jgi:hypothetical protein
MFEDPIVEEVRRIRHAHAAQFNNDIAAIAADLRRLERESGLTFVNFPPSLLKKQPAESEQQPQSPAAI